MTFYKKIYVYIHFIDGEKTTKDFPRPQHDLGKSQKTAKPMSWRQIATSAISGKVNIDEMLRVILFVLQVN